MAHLDAQLLNGGHHPAGAFEEPWNHAMQPPVPGGLPHNMPLNQQGPGNQIAWRNVPAQNDQREL